MPAYDVSFTVTTTRTYCVWADNPEQAKKRALKAADRSWKPDEETCLGPDDIGTDGMTVTQIPVDAATEKKLKSEAASLTEEEEE